MTLRQSALALALTAALAGCAQHGQAPEGQGAPVAQQAEANALASRLFDTYFEQEAAHSPMMLTGLGRKDRYDEWDDLSAEAHQAGIDRARAMLARLEALDEGLLDDQNRLSLTLLRQDLEDSIRDSRWREHGYPVNQMYGWHSMPVAFLINQHRIDSESDAWAYIQRLRRLPALLAQVETQLSERADKGIIAPAFVFEHVLRDIDNITGGRPFDDADKASTLLADFHGKVEKAGLANGEQLVNEASEALRTQVAPAYAALKKTVQAVAARADSRDGAWKLPDGDAYYQARLREMTTTELSAEQIHRLGLEQVERIHGEMKAIKDKVGFKGDLKAFFEFMRSDDRFYYPNTEAGRQRYLKEATALIDNMKGRLDELFGVKPRADLVVKAVEAFRERSAGKAFYQQPAPDGSRPGYYYANLYNMKDMPIYQMEALAYHEGIPGHHMQIAIAQELQGIPKFRRFGGYTAYIEGWGLYSEEIPKEIGLYQDPYSDFGRLAMELWRACRLVVDTGIHAKKWSREQAIRYLLDNTPNPEGDAVKAIERYIVMPGQATAYMVGKLHIKQLRAKAEAELGDDFDIRAFHDVILAKGPLPLNVLSRQVEDWIAAVKG
ncbi:DUF885 domain-containing protein [Gallaecimonas sp. GXIMD4217]|uniref:DUF885 domain-containing protein n=1 Tax=Gallaecimonas sp. GXIMD4217 TaxID=3131927 RepID=UPI00311B2700